MLETLHSNTPYILVHEGDAEHGGASLDVLRAECERNVDEEGVAERIFDGETPIIPWLRLREYQVARLTRDPREICARSDESCTLGLQRGVAEQAHNRSTVASSDHGDGTSAHLGASRRTSAYLGSISRRWSRSV